MDGGVLHIGDALDQIGHAPRRPEARAVPQRFGAARQPAFDAPQIRRRQLRGPSRPRRAFQGGPATRRELLRPAVDRLAMHAYPTRDVRFADASLQQACRAQAPPFQLHPIPCDPGWMSHAASLHGFVAYVTMFCNTQ